MIYLILANILVCFLSCSTEASDTVVPKAVSPDVVTEKVKHDSDDPAIWINKADPASSIIFGTDKNSDGALFAFDLEGDILEEKTIKGLKRPNNVDIRYDFKLNDAVTVDILAFTEREKGQVRLFSVPDMKPLDNGGFPVFSDEERSEFRQPMGISLYHSPLDGSFYLIVGRKEGPEENYLYQYKLDVRNSGIFLELVRKFGRFSGNKEIEAIAVDDELGYIYYADEKHCIRKYHAEPSKGDEELACFGGDFFEEDIEGIAIAAFENEEGVLIVSDQQENSFNLFSRSDNRFIKKIELGTKDTDGCDVVTVPLNDTFKTGLFVAMNNEKNFFLYDLKKLQLPLLGTAEKTGEARKEGR